MIQKQKQPKIGCFCMLLELVLNSVNNYTLCTNFFPEANVSLGELNRDATQGCIAHSKVIFNYFNISN